MTPAPSRPAQVMLVGAGLPTALLARHLLDASVEVASRHVGPGGRLPDFTRYGLVLMLYAQPGIAERMWPRILGALSPGTLLLQLGAHNLENFRRCYYRGLKRDIHVVHAPLTWTPQADRLYLHTRSARTLATHQRRADPTSENHAVLDALRTLRRATTRTLLGPPHANRVPTQHQPRAA